MVSTIQTLVLLRLLIHTTHVFHMRCLGNVSSMLQHAVMPIVSYMRELKAFHSLLVRPRCQADGGTHESTFSQPTTFLAYWTSSCSNILALASELPGLCIFQYNTPTLGAYLRLSSNCTPLLRTSHVFLLRKCVSLSYFFPSKVRCDVC